MEKTKTKQGSNTNKLKQLFNRKTVGWFMFAAGLIAIILALPAILVYALPLAQGGSSSQAMAQGFKSLTLFKTGAGHVRVALILGVLSIVIGSIFTITGMVMALLPTVTFKTMTGKVLGIIGVSGSAILVVPSATAIGMGISKPVKELNGFQKINDLYKTSFKASAGELAAIIYATAAAATSAEVKTGMPAGKTITYKARMHENGVQTAGPTKGTFINKKADDKLPETEALKNQKMTNVSVSFNPAKAAKRGEITDGLTYTYTVEKLSPEGTTSSKGGKTEMNTRSFSGSEIFKLVEGVQVPKNDELKAVHSIFYNNVYDMWETLRKQSDTKKDTNKLVPLATKTGRVSIYLKGSLPLISQAANLIYTTLLGTEKDEMTSLSTIDNTLTPKDRPTVLEQAVIGLGGLSAYGAKALQMAKQIIVAVNAGDAAIAKLAIELVIPAVYPKLSKAPKFPSMTLTQFKKLANWKQGQATVISQKGDKALHALISKTLAKSAAPTIAKFKGLSALVNIFNKKTESLLYKLEQFRAKFGNQAASEGLYLYFARISEISSDRFFGYTSGDVRSQTTLTNPKRFDVTLYNMAGRQGSRALLVSSFRQWKKFSANPKSLFSKLTKDVDLKDKLAALQTVAKYSSTTKTIDFEAVYKIFDKNQK